ncbi:hypothetical protein CSKR_112941 [Clonorchis sinensis]|uniref:Uncharacterized protein n=1 Tax=Clonorchis sinensis TaxID=79923 RepID=A0A419PGD8_CLOSI|nr:hypothetical protein CSKR_112941 [Clonorchis sinensis]
MHPCYWKGGGYTKVPCCNVEGRPSLQGVLDYHTRFSFLVHATRSAQWKSPSSHNCGLCTWRQLGPSEESYSYLKLMERVGERVRSRVGREHLRVCYQNGYGSAVPSLAQHTSVFGQLRNRRYI